MFGSRKKNWHKYLRFIPASILIISIILIYFFNIHQKVSFEYLLKEHHQILDFVHTHRIISHFLYIGFYILSICLIIPDSTLLNVFGGMIFPLPVAFIYSVLSEVLGATIFFAVFKKLFNSSFLQVEHRFFHKMRTQFNDHSFSYLLFLRFSHLVPFWLINVGAAYFKVGYKPFILTTFIGVLPLCYILASAGQSLSKMLAKNQIFSIGQVFTLQLKIALLVMGILSLFPILYQKWKNRK